MKKILFVTLGHLSAGEFTIAFEFCKGLPQKDFDICFLTSSKGVAYLKDNNIKYVCLEKSESNLEVEDKIKNREITDDLMKEFQPDLVIASDIYTLWYSNTWTGLDLDVFKTYKVPIGSFDSYEFASTDFIQDYYGGYKANIPDYINQCDFVIRYCPLNKVNKNEDRVKYTYLFKEKIVPSEQAYQQFREKFKPNQEKVIFMTNSNWESLNVNRLPALSNLMNWTPKIILNYISQLDEEITVIHVGPFSYKNIIDNNKIKYHHYSYIKSEQFDEYLACSDLYITTNIISSTLVKSIYSNVPAIVLQNNKIVKFQRLQEQLKNMPKWYREMAEEVKVAYPFRVFPFGWFKFLEPLLENNEFLDTFVQSGLFQNGKTSKLIRTYLYNKSERVELIKKQSLYVDKVSQLSSPAELIKQLNNL